jgi:3-deoxy-manno-octulosonate cytidylyltransferase (CMP-KDO synthetase)
MVQWVFEQAQKASLVSEIVVATDDQRIFDAVRAFGGKAVMTSPDHQSGTDRSAEVAKNSECDIVVNIQGDEPLIPPENIDLVIKPLLSSPDLPVSTLMIAIRSLDEMFNPNICKVVVDDKGRALYFTRAPVPYHRDSWPDAIHSTNINTDIKGYKHIGMYAYRKSFLMQFSELKTSHLENLEKLEQLRILENGYSIQVMETDQNSVGVDRPEDLTEVAQLINN